MESIAFLTSKRIPHLPEKLENNQVSYEIFSNFVTARIYQNIYKVTEHQLTAEDQEKYNKIKNGLVEQMNFSIYAENRLINLKEAIDKIKDELHIKTTQEEYQKIFYLIYIEFLGLWRIEPLMEDPMIQKIVCKKTGPTMINHVLYGTLTTNIQLAEDGFQKIGKKLAIVEEDNKGIVVERTENSITITKKTEDKNPISLLLNKNASPEMLAFLWMLIENRKPIMLTDNLLSTANIFLPSNSRVLTNETNITLNKNCEYIFSDTAANEEFALIKDIPYLGNGSPILVSKTVDEQNFFVFYVENKTIYKIKEKGKEIFVKKGDKFYQNPKESLFLNTQTLNDELKLRTKLLLVLTHNKLNLKDFRQVINVYYKDRTAVLKRAGLI